MPLIEALSLWTAVLTAAVQPTGGSDASGNGDLLSGLISFFLSLIFGFG